MKVDLMKLNNSEDFNIIVVPENDMEENLIKLKNRHLVEHLTPNGRVCAVVLNKGDDK